MLTHLPSRVLPIALCLQFAVTACGQAAASGTGSDVDFVFVDTGAKPHDGAGTDAAEPDTALADLAADDAPDAATDDAVDAAVLETVAPDADDADAATTCEFAAAPAPGQPGHACGGPADCESGYCVEGPAGKVCSKACIDCCPTGFKCEQFGGTGDLTFVCAPKWTALCRPCEGDSDCVSSGKDALCVAYGDSGSFCGAACGSNSDCPTDFTCQDAIGEAGSSKQCVRATGVCGCSPAATAAGAHTTCHNTSAAGSCAGTRKCTASGLTPCPAAMPSIEVCGNALDDDCNGLTDENKAQGCVTYFPDKDGDGDGLLGSAGVCQCAATDLYHAVTAADCNDVSDKVNQWAVEICDGVDNNCNGKTDEGCDDDGDGYCDGNILLVLAPICPKGGNDCDDADSAVHPGAQEVCGNGEDDDCNGLTDAGTDVDGCVAFFQDADGDGYGGGAASCLCSAKGLYTAHKNGDCDDSNAAMHPGQPDICGNGKDDNCDGATDEPGSTGCADAFADADEDGFGAGAAVCLCAPDAAHSAKVGGDCDDKVASTFPGAPEACNGVDDNCDGTTDEAGASGCTTWFVDADGDGYGNPASGLCLCGKTALSTTKDGSDCNDGASEIHPNAAEVCDGVDNNCNGATDEAGTAGCTTYFADGDGDGWGDGSNTACLCGASGVYTATVAGDCDDTSAAIHPGAVEVCDGVDNNCANGTDEVNAGGCKMYLLDSDGDGFGVTGNAQCLCSSSAPFSALFGGDCDDGAPDVHPKALESCNGIDDDCDGQTDPPGSESCKMWFVDADGDGYGTYLLANKCLCAGITGYASIGGDCDDGDATVHPNASEICNGKDDNCDTAIDPKGSGGCVTYYFDGDQDGYGLTAVSQCQCGADGGFSATAGGDCNDSSAAINPGVAESCNGADDNCNGATDEGLATTTWFLDGDKDGYGTGSGTTSCGAVNGLTATVSGDCNDSNASIHPNTSETCGNSIDDNCNGATDENCCPSGKSTMNGVCVSLNTAALNAGGKDTVTSVSIPLYIVPPGNLVSNGGAETSDFSSWTKTDGGDGWVIGGGGYGLPVPFGAHVFRTSYSMCYLAQTVDLTAAGISDAGLDGKTVLHAGAFAMGWGCKDTVGGSCGTSYSDDSFVFDLRYLNSAGAQVGAWTSSTYSLKLGVWAAPFQDASAYPTGTRKVQLQVSGEDGEGWSGQYGPSIDGVYLVYGTLEMRISNDGKTWSAWQAFAPVVSGWSLVAGAGSKTVTVEFRDGTGTSLGTVSDTVVLQ